MHQTQEAVLLDKLHKYSSQARQELRDGELSGRTELKVRVSLPHICAALQAIKDGTYGICADCGEDIPKKRLQVVPGATRCVACQELHDRDKT